MSNKETIFYNNLKKKLEETVRFPSQYVYKFIVPAESLSVIKKEIGTEKGLVIKNSKTNKYNSVSLKKIVTSSDEVVKQYQKLAHIRGIIML